MKMNMKGYALIAAIGVMCTPAAIVQISDI